ncbi:hypothetical protein [Treponema sp.]|uniref:hypothetical protein n=1 Tax=Treponema sp. TaxID=166 RepID=UPI0025E8D947|nr:hypothetical protein [Treponema sp.]MCR5218187.1 hypothetical protein [Treponema sp.]
MLLKLIGILIVAVVVAVLTGFNLDNRCDVWIFHNFENVPVFYTILASFIAGVIITVFVQAFNSSSSSSRDEEYKSKKPGKEKKDKHEKKEEDVFSK